MLRSFFKRKEDANPMPQQVIIKTPSFKDRMANMIAAGFAPKCIFDCGASVGQWSYEVSKLFPGAQIVAIEPNSMVIKRTREQLKSIKPEVIIEQCAIGAASGHPTLTASHPSKPTK